MPTGKNLRYYCQFVEVILVPGGGASEESAEFNSANDLSSKWSRYEVSRVPFCERAMPVKKATKIIRNSAVCETLEIVNPKGKDVFLKNRHFAMLFLPFHKKTTFQEFRVFGGAKEAIELVAFAMTGLSCEPAYERPPAVTPTATSLSIVSRRRAGCRTWS